MTAGTRVAERRAAPRVPARCRAWVRTRPHVVHHLVSAVAMLACVLVDHRPVPSMLVIVGLIALSVLFAIRARGVRSARELVLDLGVMAIVMLAMAPWAASAMPPDPAMSMSPASTTTLGHGVGTAPAVLMVLAVALWAVARVGLLLAGGRPRTSAVLGAGICSACLAAMIL